MKRQFQILFILFSFCYLGCENRSVRTQLKYTIIDSSCTTGEGCQFNVEIPKRYSKQEIDTISSIIRERKSLYPKLKIFLMLPGQVLGEGFVYGNSFYASDPGVKKLAKLKDLNNEPFDIDLQSISPLHAKKLLSINPPNIQYKTIIGKFINDVQETVTILYIDKREDQKLIFMMDFDIDGNNIKGNNIATPKILDKEGGLKLIVDKDGDYYYLKDSVLKRYNLDDSKEIPYRSIKSGV